VDVLDGLVDEGAEQHRADADGGELELLEEAVLLGAVLEERDVRGEGVFALEVDFLHLLEGEPGQVDRPPVRKGVEDVLEILRG